MLFIRNSASRFFHRLFPPIHPLLTQKLHFSCYSPPPFTPVPDKLGELNAKGVASSFKEWFKLRTETDVSFNSDVDRVCQILDSLEEIEGPLSQLRLELNEELVVKVIKIQKEVLPCLKFFDWAGRQPSYSHTRAAYHAIFKKLSKAKLMSIMLDWLQKFSNQRNVFTIRFFDTLVMGYAVVGKPEIALQHFGRMRFTGQDLNDFAYNVLLNALVEENLFDVVDVISKQITLRGFDNVITSCIRLRSFCKQNRLEEAKAYLHGLDKINDDMLVIVVDTLCNQKRFVEARDFIGEFGSLGRISLANTRMTWINNFVQAGRIDEALECFQNKSLEGFKPDAHSYNALIRGLLKENRLGEVYALFVEMRERQISPDKHTMDATLCFFCKAGLVDVAIELYNDRFEMGHSPSSLAYSHLINGLCDDGKLDEACKVFEDCVKQGCFPSNRTFNMLANVLCQNGELDNMSRLIDLALQRNIVPCNAICARYISALCNAGRVTEAFLLPDKLKKTGDVLKKYTYFDLIRAFSEIKRGDMASRLLLEMQDYGHEPTRGLYKSVIACLCETGKLNRVLELLDIHLSQHTPNAHVYNFFMYGCGHAGQPDLAREVFGRMVTSGCEPNFNSYIIMLQCYLKNKQIVNALNFFTKTCRNLEPKTKLYNVIICSLSQTGKIELALEFLKESREIGLYPSLQCYEELISALCSSMKYNMALKLLVDLEKTGRRFSPFIFNHLLLHTLKSQGLHQAWAFVGDVIEEASQPSTMAGRELVAAFSGGILVQHHLENLDEFVERYFRPDIHTYNILLRGLCKQGEMDYAYDLFQRICDKGYEPNSWTYDILVKGFCKLGRKADADIWMDEMAKKGFDLTPWTHELYQNLASKKL